MAIYLDCNATTPIDPRVRDAVLHYMDEEFGNSGSRTHEYGARALEAVQSARRKVASVVDARPDEVIFTSGATESNNIALLGLARHGEETGRRHIVSTQIEHKAVLEPIEALASGGFEVTLVPPTAGGWVEPDAVVDAVRDDTLLVSIMHVNNETGVLQPIEEIAGGIARMGAFLHVDAAQGFGKDLPPLKRHRIDLISISGHKIYGPKGCGALVVRSRGYQRPPLQPLTYGGGQERGLRPGTVPVHLVVGLGLAAALAERESSDRAAKCAQFREEALSALLPLDPHINGDPDRTQPHVLNLSFPGIDSEAAMLALRDLVAVSNGSACTSVNYSPSHVLQAMGLSGPTVEGGLRLSWCHGTEPVDWKRVTAALTGLR